MNDQKIRLFIAVPIEEQSQMLTSMQQYAERTLNPLIVPAAFYPSKDFHVTIAYIGSISKEFLDLVQMVLEHAVEQFQHINMPVRLKWQGEMRLFNNALSVTFAYDQGILLLARIIHEALIEAEIPFDQRYDFTPHMTLGRIKPIEALRKASVKRALQSFLETSSAHTLEPIAVKRVGLYISGETEPFFVCPLH